MTKLFPKSRRSAEKKAETPTPARLTQTQAKIPGHKRAKNVEGWYRP